MGNTAFYKEMLQRRRAIGNSLSDCIDCDAVTGMLIRPFQPLAAHTVRQSEQWYPAELCANKVISLIYRVTQKKTEPIKILLIPTKIQ